MDVWGALANNVFFAANREVDVRKAQTENPNASIMWGWDWPHVDAVQVPNKPGRWDNALLVNSWHAVQRLYPQLAAGLGEGATEGAKR